MTNTLQLIRSLPLKHPSWIKILFNASLARDNGATFDEIIFRAKFVSQTRKVMERIGGGAQGYAELSRELKENITTLQKLFMKLSVGKEFEREFSALFLLPTAEAFARFLQLIGDCTLVKNAILDA